MIIIFTGNGKGKTTAALGQALRAIGNRRKVLMVQFIKGPWKSGEDDAYARLKPDFEIVKTGKGFVGIGKNPLPFEKHQEAAHEGLLFADAQAASKKWDVVILDEVWNALKLELLDAKSIQDFIDKHSKTIEHLILTGRDCPQEFIDQASIVTEMREVKHPFSHGVKGAQGLEY